MKTIQEFKTDVKTWWYGVTWNAKRRITNAKKWCEQNPELTIVFASLGLTAAKGIGKTVRSIDRKIDLKKAQELQDLYVYDHSLGMYHKLRRPLTPHEKTEIDRRRHNGESKIHILASMGLLD